ncbi:hypothetical protein JHD49_02000 [Sulfurimonas sp. SAG-AH-194-C21]|nr:hypothetical protein [Sulfurimonas sp. SAG-AH-194-C21]MDF1882707.1 hypothetical protein [Sulfurimonas sp. SAG-AH-194-C21]
MQISANLQSTTASMNSNTIKSNYTEKLTKQEATDIRAKITENANAFALKSVNLQGNLVSQKVDIAEEYANFQTFLSDIGYEGKPIADLSQEEAGALVSEDGFFGITQTSERIANFVIAGAGGDEDRLRAGREGMLQGFKDAESMWGGALPDISQKTMQAAVELVDKKMNSLGFSILNQEA